MQNGDTLQSIAAKYGTNPNAIAKKNKINANAPLQPGTQLRITKGSGSSSSSSSD